jgi:hypothetical protein
VVLDAPNGSGRMPAINQPSKVITTVAGPAHAHQISIRFGIALPLHRQRFEALIKTVSL